MCNMAIAPLQFVFRDNTKLVSLTNPNLLIWFNHQDPYETLQHLEDACVKPHEEDVRLVTEYFIRQRKQQQHAQLGDTRKLLIIKDDRLLLEMRIGEGDQVAVAEIN